MLDHLSLTQHIEERTKELISIGGLCHDIGHGPGSHVFDKHILPKLVYDKIIPKDHPWLTHEERSVSMFRVITQDVGMCQDDVDFVCNVIEPPKGETRWEFNIVNNTEHGIDTDKLDYIARDGYMLGLRLSIDFNQIIQNSRIVNNKWAFSKSIQDELLNVIFVRYRIHRILNQARIVKFDLSYRDIITHSPSMCRDLGNIFVNNDIDGFVKYTDSYVLQNGTPENVACYNTRHTYTQVSGFSNDDEIEDVLLNIKICNVHNNAMANIPFYDPKTSQSCDISQSTLDMVLPSKEVMSYVYKYDKAIPL